MRIKFILLILLAAIIAGWGAFKISSRSQEQELAELQNASDRGSIYWHARAAKAKGKREVVLSAPIVEYSLGIRSLDKLLPQVAVIVAQPVEKKTLIASTNEIYADNEIRTWYKFKILDNVSGKPIPKCSTCGSNAEQTPQNLLPLAPDEILIETYGGTLEVDGVKVSVVNAQIPEFSLSESYLLFLLADTSGRIGLLRMGPVGVYSVGSNGIIKPISKVSHPIVNEIESRFGSSLQALRLHVQKQPILQ